MSWFFTYAAAVMHHDGLTELVSYDADFDFIPFSRRKQP